MYFAIVKVQVYCTAGTSQNPFSGKTGLAASWHIVVAGRRGAGCRGGGVVARASWRGRRGADVVMRTSWRGCSSLLWCGRPQSCGRSWRVVLRASLLWCGRSPGYSALAGDEQHAHYHAPARKHRVWVRVCACSGCG